jgi:hypothetical protein
VLHANLGDSEVAIDDCGKVRCRSASRAGSAVRIR